MRTWEHHDISTTKDYNGNIEQALRAIQTPLIYMPSETDLYFPVGDARYEAAFIRRASLVPIPSLWGHTAGAASNPVDAAFLNKYIGDFLSGTTRPPLKNEVATQPLSIQKPVLTWLH